jgi:hypothetical protein
MHTDKLAAEAAPCMSTTPPATSKAATDCLENRLFMTGAYKPNT